LGRLIELEPQNASNYSIRGTIHKNKENYAQALKDYSTAIELDPKGSVYYYNRALTYYKIENTN
jgi:tetratricopeptide (TPR) repeat protein